MAKCIMDSCPRWENTMHEIRGENKCSFCVKLLLIGRKNETLRSMNVIFHFCRNGLWNLRVQTCKIENRFVNLCIITKWPKKYLEKMLDFSKKKNILCMAEAGASAYETACIIWKEKLWWLLHLVLSVQFILPAWSLWLSAVWQTESLFL